MSELRISNRTAAPDGGSVASPSLTLHDVFDILKSHAAFIAICTVSAVAACLLYLVLHHPVYNASAVIRIDPTRVNDLAVGTSQGGFPIDESSLIQTEVGVLQSNRVAIRTLDSLTTQDFQEATGLSASHKPSISRDIAITKADALILAKFEKNLKIAPQAGTELIIATFRDRDSALAARVANGVVAAYVSESLSSRKDSVAQLRSSLSQEINGLREQVDQSQKRLSEFREANGILDTQATSNTTLDKLRFLNDRLAQAQADLIIKDAAVQAAGLSTPESLASLYPNSNLSQLQVEQAQLNTRFAQLAAKFDSQYPPLIDVKRQIALVSQQLSENAQLVRKRLRQESNAAQFVQRDLQNRYDTQLASAYKLNRSQAEYAVLQAQVTSGRDLLSLLQTKMQQAVVNAEVTGANVVVVDDASIPSTQSGPKTSVLIASSLLLGFLAGAMISLLFEGTSRKLRLVSDAERWTGVPVLAAIPDHWSVPKLDDGSDPSKPVAVLGDPHQVGTGPYQEVRNRLLLSSSSLHKIVLVAGVSKEDSADVATIHVAAAFSRAGYKVLVVDADVRRRMATKYLESDNPWSQNALLKPTIHLLKELHGVSLVSMAGGSTPIGDQIASKAFASVMQGWATDFDIVLIGTGGLLSSENLLLASRAGSTLLVARYGRTSTDTIAGIRDRLSDLGASLSGMLITDVP